ncbi:translation initiation factor eIF-2 beta subunit [Exophiala xenobiotica]
MAEVVSTQNVRHSPHLHPASLDSQLKPPAPRPTAQKSTPIHLATDIPAFVQTDHTDNSLLHQEIPQAPHERKARKSVAFSGDDTVMDENGEISEVPTNTAEDNPTAEKHSSAPDSSDKPVDEMTDMFAGLNKKKKKSSSKPKIADGETPADSEAAPVDDAFDPTALKKKKKKSTKKTEAAGDDFAAKLASAGLEPGADGSAETSADQPQEQEGDMSAGTGIWAHEATTPISYDLLLKRFFQLVNEHNPDILSSGSRSYKIPPPQCLREGNKKTIFANIAEICKRMNRNDEHVTQFLFAELGTSGSVDGSKRLVIKGRFQQKQIENVLRRYIVEYVTCKTCRSPNTELSKGENRLYFVTCNSCGSRRSVTAIKSGFTAQVGKRKRMQG